MARKKKFQHSVVSKLKQGTNVLLVNGAKATVVFIDEHSTSFYPAIAINREGIAGLVRDFIYPNHIKEVIN